MKVFPFQLLIIFLLTVNISTAQEIISGIIIDTKGEALVGANIHFEKNGQFNGGTSTDFDGNFTMPTGNADSILVSYIGYADYKCSVEDLIFDNLIMVEPAIHELEVVVVKALSKLLYACDIISCGMGIPANENENQISVSVAYDKIEWTTYPNPTTTFIEIKSIDPEIFGTIELFDQHGRLVKQAEYSNSAIRMNLIDLLPGQYYAWFNNSELTGFVGKVIKIDRM